MKAKGDTVRLCAMIFFATMLLTLTWVYELQEGIFRILWYAGGICGPGEHCASPPPRPILFFLPKGVVPFVLFGLVGASYFLICFFLSRRFKSLSRISPLLVLSALSGYFLLLFLIRHHTLIQFSNEILFDYLRRPNSPLPIIPLAALAGIILGAAVAF